MSMLNINYKAVLCWTEHFKMSCFACKVFVWLGQLYGPVLMTHLLSQIISFLHDLPSCLSFLLPPSLVCYVYIRSLAVVVCCRSPLHHEGVTHPGVAVFGGAALQCYSSGAVNMQRGQCCYSSTFCNASHQHAPSSWLQVQTQWDPRQQNRKGIRTTP